MIVDTHGVVTEIARHRDTAFQFGLNARKQTVCMRVAQLRRRSTWSEASATTPE